MNIYSQNNTARQTSPLAVPKPVWFAKSGLAGRDNRGSVLIMVVGLLTMLFMLGMTFLAISHMNAKQSAALAEKNPADPAALGLLNNLLTQIRADRHAGGATNTPYGQLATGSGGVEDWKRYIDYPLPDQAVGAVKTDDWLASSGTTVWSASLGKYVIPHISIPTLSSTVNTTNVTAYVVSPSALATAAPDRLVDTDGDGFTDSSLFDTGITNNNGEHYWAAICVRDASSMINLNTAGTVTATSNMPSYTSPVSVDLYNLLGHAKFELLHYNAAMNSRYPGASSMYYLYDYNRDCAAFVMSPINNASLHYRPYAIGDEAFLRWNGTTGANFVGRLNDSGVFSTSALLATRPLLTTYNSSSQFSRTGTTPTVVNNNDIVNATFQPIIPYDLLTSVVAQDNLYHQVASYLEKTGLATTTDAPKMAACFVANTLTYADNLTALTTPRQYPPAAAGSTFTAYGTLPGCVITEVVAASQPDTTMLAKEHMYFYAFEVWNPTGANITYSIYDQDGSIIAGTARTLTPGQRIVYYNCDQGPASGSSGVNDYHIWIPGMNDASAYMSALAPNSVLSTWLDLSLGRSFRLVRDKWPTHCVMDSVCGVDIGYNVADKLIVTPAQPAYFGQRDDEPNRMRYNAAAYHDSKADTPKHTLGQPNNLTYGTLIAAQYPYPIVNPTIAGWSGLLGLRNIGDLGQVYFAAATWDSTVSGADAALPFSKNVIDTYTTTPASVLFKSGPNSQTAPGRLDPRANVNTTEQKYPDVPRAAMLNEFLTMLPGDFTRADNNKQRVYGKLNINTATREALVQLPFFTTAAPITGLTAADGTAMPNIPIITKAAAVEFILAYRDRRQVDQVSYPGSPDYRTAPAGPTRTVATGIANLRDTAAGSDINGFLTPGEVAIPLADYAHWLMGCASPFVEANNRNITQAYWYVDLRDAMYRSISNLITVNSDVFVVNMMLQLQPANDATAAEPAKTLPLQRWHYVAVIDRGNCMSAGDTPAVLLFSEVK
jgi:hypothetical protein